MLPLASRANWYSSHGELPGDGFSHVRAICRSNPHTAQDRRMPLYCHRSPGRSPSRLPRHGSRFPRRHAPPDPQNNTYPAQRLPRTAKAHRPHNGPPHRRALASSPPARAETKNASGDPDNRPPSNETESWECGCGHSPSLALKFPVFRQSGCHKLCRSFPPPPPESSPHQTEHSHPAIHVLCHP